MPLDEDAARLAKGQNLATVVTLMPDGRPQAQLTWIDHDGENILVNTEPQRQKSRNVRRDPRVTVLIHSATDTQDWAEIRGRVVQTIDGARARTHIDELARRYVGSDFDPPLVGPHGRIILVIAPDKVNTPRLLETSRR
jgi:PPOX class probable F420-dependent enzyme